MARRFRIYFFGVLLGLILVYTSLVKDRSKELLGWLPGARVLRELKEAPRIISDKASCQLKCLTLGESFVDELFEDGDVDFSQSRPKEIPRYYIVEIEKNDVSYMSEIIFQDSTTTIQTIKKVENQQTCECN